LEGDVKENFTGDLVLLVDWEPLLDVALGSDFSKWDLGLTDLVVKGKSILVLDLELGEFFVMLLFNWDDVVPSGVSSFTSSD